jgi:hypothetical protein
MGTGAQPPSSPGRAGQGAVASLGSDGAGAEPLAARAPDFFVVGHQKSGTTALYEMLRLHPQVFLPVAKEPQFLASDLRGSRLRSSSTPPGESGLPRTLEAYLALFAAAREDQRIGDPSPQYLRSGAAARNIAELRPDAQIVAILREPADFVRSFHHQLLISSQENEPDLRKAVALEASRREGSNIPSLCHQPRALLYAEHVRYVEQLRRFHDVFPREQVLVLLYDDFRRDNLETLREILVFLGLDPLPSVKPVQTRPLNAVRSMALHKLAGAARHAEHHPEIAGRRGAMLRAATALPRRSKALRKLTRSLTYTAPGAPDEAFLDELRVRFKPEVVALSEYLGRDLTALWGYDQLG